MFFTKQFRNKIKYWIIITLSSLFFLWWFSNAADDLLHDIIEPAYDAGTVIKLWDNVDTVWNEVIGWSYVAGDGQKQSLIIRVTKFLLYLVVTLSVTMILYNWLTYIIQTWQWKDSKDLTKNIIYIVVWILVALFSVAIITLIQSIPTTLDKEW